MIVGNIFVSEIAVETHRDSYMLSQISVASCRRPFFAPSFIIGIGLCAFVWAFRDLLYLYEQLLLAGLSLTCLLIGATLGQLQLLSRDLRGTELRTAIFGTYPHLNCIRRQIAVALSEHQKVRRP